MKKQKKNQLKQVQNQAQEGRSMVEMLGVLAIIGVISIGGIAGYRWGMDKHVSNQILYEMNLNSAQLAMLLQKGNPDGVTLSLGSPYDEGKFRTVDYGFAYACGEEASFGHDCKFIDETMYSMTATGLPKRVCNMLGDAVFGMAYYYDSEINGGDNECNDTNNTVTVFFNTDTTIEGGIPRPEESETHTPTTEDNDPVPEECPGSTWLSEDGRKCTCDEDEKTCNGSCCAGCEGGKVWDENSNNCVCPTGAVESEEGCACSGDKPYWDGSKCTMCPEEAPWDETTKQCKCADSNKVWKESKKACVELVGECESNADCGPGEYCYLEYGYGGYGCGDDKEFDPNQFGVGYSYSTGYTSECRNALSDAKEGETTHFVGSKSEMTWWSAGRFCAALGRKQATHDIVKCSINPDASWCIDMDSNIRADLSADFGEVGMWLSDVFAFTATTSYVDDVCYAYTINLDLDEDVGLYNGARIYGYYALCE